MLNYYYRNTKGNIMYAYCPFCNQKYEIEQGHIGISIECASCGKGFIIQEHQLENNNAILLNSITEETTMKEYKVLTQKDKWFSQKFDPEALEKALNSYASQGWKVVSAVTANIAGLGGNREEIIIILERDK